MSELCFHCLYCETEIDDPESMEGMCADCYWDTEKLYRGKPLQFTVYENGKLFPLSQMSQPEQYAIQCEVEQIVGDKEAFEVELDHGVVRCPTKPSRLMEFQGKTYKIGQTIQIKFETILCD
jgi:hypothetical protein